MKTLHNLLLTAILSSCLFQTANADNSLDKNKVDSIIASYNAEGAVLILDYQAKVFLTNDSTWATQGNIPASTFKIPNTLIALESGTITTETIFEWDGEPRFLKEWEADMNIQTAYNVSCVPVYQSIARSIGSQKMKTYIAMMDYGAMDINDANIDEFWLKGNSHISQYQQIYFLQRLYEETLPLKKETMRTVKDIMIRQQGEGYILRAKTGMGIRQGTNIGWYVGYLETKGNVYFFATNIKPVDNENMPQLNKARIDITKTVLGYVTGIKL